MPANQGQLDPSILASIHQNLQPGMSGPDVAALQNALMQAGYPISQATGYYGNETMAAVSKWQQASGIQAGNNYGYFGPQSIAYLQSQGGGSSTGAPGATDASGQPVIANGGTPYFNGNEALVKFANGEDGYGADTYWLVDNSTKTARPFSSTQALQTIFGNNLNQALSSVVTINAPAMSAGGMISSGPLSNFNVLDSSYAVQPDGSMKQIAATTAQLQAKYGQQTNPTAETSATQIVDNMLTLAEHNPTQSGLDPTALQQLSNDSQLMTKYVSALAYGGYAPADVYADIKRTILATQGNTSAQSEQVISPTMTKTQYGQTTQGSVALNDATLKMPQSFGQLAANNLGLAIYNTPDSLYQTPSSFVGQNGSSSPLPPLAGMSQSDVDAAMAKINQVTAAYYDVVQQQLSATTQQESALANYNWTQFKQQAESTLGINLSNDALNAWTQIQSLSSQYGQLNLEGSGLQNEGIDSYLQRVRANDAIQRTQTQNSETNAQETYYMQYATPDQIAQLVSSNPTLAAQFGLTPSAAVAASLTPAALMAKYPGLTAAQANQYISTVLDANGNYRSQLYNNYMTQQQAAIGQEYSVAQSGQTALSTQQTNQQMSPYTKDPFMTPDNKTPVSTTVNGLPASSGSTTPSNINTQAPSTTPQSNSTAPGAKNLDPSILSSINSNLGPGSTGAQVKALQQALVNAGYMTSDQMATGPGTYGAQTQAAVTAWQKANNINTNGNDGYFGPASQSYLKTPSTTPTTQPTSSTLSGTSNTSTPAIKAPTYSAPVINTNVPTVTTPTPNTSAGSTNSGYTFFKNADGNIETSQNGSRISTGSASSAKNAYGYTGN